MSSPGGPWGSDPNGQQYDPLTGQPTSGAQGQQPGGQYQGFGAFGQPQQPPQFQQPQYQQPQYQQQYPGMISGFPTPPPKKSRGPMIAAIALGAVAVIAIVTTIVVLIPSSDEAAPTPPPAKPTTSQNTPTQAPTTQPTAANPDLPPVVPGWQVVRVPKRTALYDVPMGWVPDPDPENIQAYGPPDDPVTMTGVADYQVGFCPGDPRSYRATSGVSARKGPDDTAVATETLAKLVDLAYSRDGVKPVVETGPPEQIQLPGNTPAVRVTARVTIPQPGPCDSPKTLASVVATNSDGQSSVVLMAVADQDVEGATTADQLNQLTGSLRAAP
ncbi:transmembrane domain-containing protein [Saccharopolyspora sp. WRP15-2]|uniref:Transmembrane domain-containing protein n=1 Tax=Saccharopolyspora oryzae TaxID=2997343 RepID=A0ABT4URX9_9PSEU|nr:transmembrane domain-containing protein [Saccharopolyspora oryzae]MDA3624473.1 transmembrane domain-containing protein [Saccharopolyspora oryzae]